MENNEKGNALEANDATVTRGAGMTEAMKAKGQYFVQCFSVKPEHFNKFKKLEKRIRLLKKVPFSMFNKFIDRVELEMNGMKYLKWEDTIDNVVTDVGANQLLDSAFGSGPVAGPFLGLISSVSYTSVPVVGDTMSSHGTWYEAGNGSYYPNWSTPASNARASMTFSAASGRAKALTAAVSFVIATNAGTVKGCFVVFGTGAVATNNNTSGVLYSAGVFTGGDKVLGLGDTLNVSYSTSV